MIDSKLPTVESFGFNDPNFDGDLYDRVARKANLRELCMTSSEFNIRPSLFWDAEEAGSDLKSSFEGVLSGCTFDPENGVIAGGYKWMADVRAGRSKALKNSAEYVVVYAGLVDMPEEYVNLYFSKVARFTTYPYFRAQFANNTSLGGVPMPPLPSLTDRVD